MITFTGQGKFTKTEKFLESAKEVLHLGNLDKYGRAGVKALAQATPKDSGETADSWEYRIERKGDTVSLIWNNTHENDGAKIAILLQYGHATPSGSYVQGVDYINPALKPIFEDIANNVWKEINK